MDARMTLLASLHAWLTEEPLDMRAARAGRARLEATRRHLLTPEEQKVKLRLLARWRAAEQQCRTKRMRLVSVLALLVAWPAVAQPQTWCCPDDALEARRVLRCMEEHDIETFRSADDPERPEERWSAFPTGTGLSTHGQTIAEAVSKQPACATMGTVSGPHPMKSARPPVCCDPERRTDSSGGGSESAGPPPDPVVGCGAETEPQEFGAGGVEGHADSPTYHCWESTRCAEASATLVTAEGRRSPTTVSSLPTAASVESGSAPIVPAESPLTIKIRAGAVSLFGAESTEPQRAVVLATRTRLTTAARPPLLLTETWLLPTPGRELSLTDPNSAQVEALDLALTLAWRPCSAWNFGLALEWGVQAKAQSPERAPQRVMAGVLVASTERAYLRILGGVDQRSDGTSWRPAALIAGWLDVAQAGDMHVSVVGSVLVTGRPRVIVGLMAGWGD